MPKVTVYIPTHNYARYLEEAIQSVLKQTMRDWELIVIDDGSADNTAEILARYRDHPQIRVIEQENKGLNVTNNIALRLANGKYIVRLDADDYFDENILLVLSNVLDTKPEIALVYPDYHLMNEDGEVIEIVRMRKVHEEVELLDLAANGACTMIRKECLLDLRGYEEEFSCQDGYSLWLRFIHRYKPYNVNIPLFYYRQHPKSLTEKREKILRTRRKIKSKFVDTYKNGQRVKVLAIIPVTERSVYRQSKPFVELAGKPLIWYTLNEVTAAKNLDRIVISSESDEVLEYARQFPNIIAIKRPATLARSSSKIHDIVGHILLELEVSRGYVPHAVCILYITTPLRRAHHIDKAIDTMTIFDVDSVISIQEELSYFYFHRRFGLSPVSESRRNLRFEKDSIYRENGSVILSKTDIIKEGHLLGKKIGHIAMLPEESVKINSDFDFWLAEKIITDLQKWKENDTKSQ